MIQREHQMNNGFSTGEEDSRGPSDQICCLVDDGERCRRSAGNASYSKRIQKTVTQRRLKLSIDTAVSHIIHKNIIRIQIVSKITYKIYYCLHFGSKCPLAAIQTSNFWTSLPKSATIQFVGIHNYQLSRKVFENLILGYIFVQIFLKIKCQNMWPLAFSPFGNVCLIN